VKSSSVNFVNVILGLWLFISAFVWPHSQAQWANTWILGVLCVIFALIAMARPAARYANLVLSVWLFISAFALPTIAVATRWNYAPRAESESAGAWRSGRRAPVLSSPLLEPGSTRPRRLE
jgi:hypothetical protein